MRKALALLLPATLVFLFFVKRNSSAPTPVPGAPGDDPLTFRLVFGEKQESPRDYSGRMTLDQGKVIGLASWRFFRGDALDGSSAWKLQTKRIDFENQPDLPRPMNTSAPVLNVVPAGVVVTVDAPMTATAHIETARWKLDIPLENLRYGRVLKFLDGDIFVQRTPTPRQVSQPAEAPHPEEYDYPGLAVTESGVVWVSWQGYKENGDHVYARYSTPDGWAEPFRLTEQKGDVFQTAVGEDSRGRIWVVWSERSNQDWDLYTRTFDGRAWSPRLKITSGNHPNFFHRLVRDPGGNLHLIWIGFRDGESHVLWSKLRGDGWSPPVEISGENAWMPEAASDLQGNLHVVWDSYRRGNYDVFLRKIGADGHLGPIEQVTRSAKFQAHASVAVDRQDRVWVAWDESGDNWGKDWNRDDMWRATTLYKDRRPRVAVLENGVWKEPTGDLMAAVPRRYSRYIEAPRLASDSKGRIWAALQIRTAATQTRADNWSNNGRWERFLTSYEGDHWMPLMPIPQTSSRPDDVFQIKPGSNAIWMAWVGDNRSFGPSAGFQPPSAVAAAGPHPPGIHEIAAASFSSDDPMAEPRLENFDDPPGGSPVIHPNEAADVRRMRAYRVSVNGTEYRILRGDFHRHTEISGDGAGDGSVEDYFRYMLDAAQMDTGIIADHNAGGDNEYSWWRTEKAIDLFYVQGRYTPLFGYERSVAYPNGHRNVVFAERGARTLPIVKEENDGKVNTGPILYPYLRQHRGICMLHSLATVQGSDYRDNDRELEPLVEIYQGYHANYEYEGAPRGETANYKVLVHERYEPSGFYWNALAKGYKLGVQASSDHVSTHSSYAMIYTPSSSRSDIVESMRKRHAYGATDNIIIDFEALDDRGRTHMMGDAFEAAAAPRFSIKLVGTERLTRVDVIKDGKFVFETQPDLNTAEFYWVDNAQTQGESYYYVRAIQIDRNLAWSSPIWVKYIVP